jgi:signal transduction protein with GAF and PtsI domain
MTRLYGWPRANGWKHAAQNPAYRALSGHMRSHPSVGWFSSRRSLAANEMMYSQHQAFSQAGAANSRNRTAKRPSKKVLRSTATELQKLKNKQSELTEQLNNANEQVTLCSGTKAKLYRTEIKLLEKALKSTENQIKTYQKILRTHQKSI